MKHTFVKTQNYERLVQAIKRAENRGAQEAGMIFVQAHPGIGKTKTIEQIAVHDKNGKHIRAKQGYTPRAFMEELAVELNVDSACRSHTLFRRLLEAMTKDTRLYIDEVQHCFADGAAVLEKIRDLTDMTGIVVVLVAGKEETWARFARQPQLASRVCEVVDFEFNSERDIKALCEQLSEVTIEADLLKRIYADSKGLMRLAKNAIANVEQIAKTNGLTSIGAKHCESFALCIEWSGKKSRAFEKKA